MLRIKTGTSSNAQMEMAQFIHVTEDTITYNTIDFTLDSLKKRNDFRPFCRFVFPLNLVRNKQIPNLYTDSATEKNYEVLFPSERPFERYSETYDSKHNEFPHLHMFKVAMSCVFYPETKNFKDALLIVVRQTPDSPLEITTTDDDGQVIPYVADYEGSLPVNDHLLPKCTLTPDSSIVSASGTDLIFAYRDINSVPKSVDFAATAKSDKGYLSHTKFDVVGGVGVFRFVPLGLPSGEKVKVQVGIGKYTDICSAELTVA